LASHLGYLLPNEKLLNTIWNQFSEFTIQHQLKPIVGHIFNFEDLPQAHELMESRNSKGKIVIKLNLFSQQR
jgi:NADPH:quinone reductase-like Zn-dependent oxidoreductase